LKLAKVPRQTGSSRGRWRWRQPSRPEPPVEASERRSKRWNS